MPPPLKPGESPIEREQAKSPGQEGKQEKQSVAASLKVLAAGSGRCQTNDGGDRGREPSHKSFLQSLPEQFRQIFARFLHFHLLPKVTHTAVTLDGLAHLSFNGNKRKSGKRLFRREKRRTEK